MWMYGRSPSGRSLPWAYLLQSVQKCFPMSSWYSPSSASPVHPRVLQRELAHLLLIPMWEGEVSDGHSKHPLNYCKVFPPLGRELIIPLKNLLVWNIFGLKKIMNDSVSRCSSVGVCKDAECARPWSVRGCGVCEAVECARHPWSVRGRGVCEASMECAVRLQVQFSVLQQQTIQWKTNQEGQN